MKKIEAIIPEDELYKVFDSRPIPDAVGEGKMFVSDVADVVDIGTKKRGESSL